MNTFSAALWQTNSNIVKLMKEQTQQKDSRRNFLKMGSVAALGMTLPLNPAFAFSASAKKLRVGIVGGLNSSFDLGNAYWQIVVTGSWVTNGMGAGWKLDGHHI